MTTTPTTSPSAVRHNPWTTRNKVGFVLLAIYALGNLPNFFEAGSTGHDGPPHSILVLDGVLAVVALVAVVMGWRSANRAAVRVACAVTVVSTITALPAFFVDTPAAVKLLVAIVVVWTVVAVGLALTPARRG